MNISQSYYPLAVQLGYDVIIILLLVDMYGNWLQIEVHFYNNIKNTNVAA